MLRTSIFSNVVFMAILTTSSYCVKEGVSFVCQLEDTSKNKHLKNVTRTFSFDDFYYSIKTNKITFRQAIYYTHVETNKTLELLCCCIQEEKKLIPATSQNILLNLANIENCNERKIETFSDNNDLEEVPTHFKKKFVYIGNPLTESIFLETPQKKKDLDNSCTIYARNSDNSLIIGSVLVEAHNKKPIPRFYIWKNVSVSEEISFKLDPLIDLPGIDKKHQLINKIIFIEKQKALVFFNDGLLLKIIVPHF